MVSNVFFKVMQSLLVGTIILSSITWHFKQNFRYRKTYSQNNRLKSPSISSIYIHNNVQVTIIINVFKKVIARKQPFIGRPGFETKLRGRIPNAPPPNLQDDDFFGSRKKINIFQF